MGSISKTKGLPRRGYRTQPRVSTLGIFKNKRFALKGREMIIPHKLAPIASQKSQCQLGRVRLVRTFDLASLQGASHLVNDSQG